MREAIASRIDAVPGDARGALLAAAVVGRTFWRNLLEAVGGVEDVDEALYVLEARDLVRRNPTSELAGDTQFSFKHMLIREVAYATLPRAARREGHAGVARYVEESLSGSTGGRSRRFSRTTGGRRGSPPVRFRICSPPRKPRAAAGRRRRCSSSTPRRSSSRRDPRMRTTIRLRRGMALKALDADHEAAAELAAALPELEGAERLDGLLYAGRAEVWCEHDEEALRYGEEALAFAEELDEPGGRAAALAVVSNALAMRGEDGDIARAVALGDEALELWPAGARRYEHADHMHLQASVKYWTGDYRGAAACGARAREAGGEVHSAHALLRGGGHRRDGERRARRARDRARQARLHARDRTRARDEPGSYLSNYQAVIFRELGDLDAARAANEAALEVARSIVVCHAASLRALRSPPDRAARRVTLAAPRPTGPRSGRTRRMRPGGRAG